MPAQQTSWDGAYQPLEANDLPSSSRTYPQQPTGRNDQQSQAEARRSYTSGAQAYQNLAAFNQPPALGEVRRSFTSNSQTSQQSGHGPVSSNQPTGAGARDPRRSFTLGRPSSSAAMAGGGNSRTAQGHVGQAQRQKDKFVPLPLEGSSPPRPIPIPDKPPPQTPPAGRELSLLTPPEDWNAADWGHQPPDDRDSAEQPAPHRSVEQHQEGRPAGQEGQEEVEGSVPAHRWPSIFARREVPASVASFHLRQEHIALAGSGTEGGGSAAAAVVATLRAADECWRGRITVYCIADACDRKTLLAVLSATYPHYIVHEYSDVLHIQTEVGAAHEKSGAESTSSHQIQGEVFFFDYGVIICWGLSEAQEHAVMTRIGSLIERVPLENVEADKFQFHYSANEPPHIQNDTITMNRKQAGEHQVRLAICHALAQSSKLSVYEQRIIGLVEETRHLPEALAEHGKVKISAKQVAKLIGKVFLQNSNVNLLSSVLDTPEFLWRAPDSLGALYERACEYLELETRVEVLNARFQVLQEMLDMLRDHQNNNHAARMEWIIIWLLCIDVVLMLFQLASLFHYF